MITPGRLLLRFYHGPVGRLRESIRNGGPIAERRTERARAEMEAAAALLPELPAFPVGEPIVVHVMTGRRFWYQTAFCLHSLARASARPVQAELYDDGTLGPDHCRLLARLGPGVRFHPAAAACEKLERFLPLAQFPFLRERWLNYPNIRKLTDIHLSRPGWKLVIDSDILFFRRPDAVLGWLDGPEQPLHAIDCEESYGYTRPLMERLAGTAIPPRVNVGLCGLRSDALDWLELERWCSELIVRERASYYLEQALVAMLVARQPGSVALPAAEYVTKPPRSEALAPTAVMHHYVAESKRWYFRQGWRRFSADPVATQP